MIIKDINEILTTNIISASPEIIVSDAITLMTVNKISALILTKDEKIEGIFTERDIVRLSDRRDEFKEIQVKEFMSSPVLTTSIDNDIYDVYGLLKKNRIRHVVVIDSKGKMAGIISQTDIVNNLGMDFFVEYKTISELMVKNVQTIKKDMLVLDAFSEMSKSSVSCLVVEENKHPIGILSERDVSPLLMKPDDLSSVKVESVMSHPVKTINKDTSIFDAVKIIKEHSFRRLVVVDENGQLSGLLTQSDIVKGLEGKYIEYLKEIIQEKDIKLNQTLNSLTEKTNFIDNILSSSKDVAIIATDLTFRIKCSNQFAKDLFGDSLKEHLDLSIADLFAKNNINIAIFSNAVEMIKKIREHKFTFKIRQEGSDKFIRARMFGIWEKSDKLDGYVLMLQDVTHSFLVQEQMDKLSKTVEHSPESVLITDNEGIIEYVNPAFLTFTGYSKAEVIGKKPNFLKSGIHNSTFYKKLWKTVTSGQPFFAVFINRKKNGETYYEEKTITPVDTFFAEFKHTHFISIGKDTGQR